MGAISFYRSAYGKSPEEAYNQVCNTTEYEIGHQDGYSGDLHAKDGFMLVQVPQGVRLTDWIKALTQDCLPEALQMHSGEFQLHWEIYQDKEEPALCFETADASPKQGERKYVFIGNAAW